MSDIDSAHEWLQAAAAELNVDPEVLGPVITELLDLTRDVAHGPSRPAAPLTAFMVGLSAGAYLPADAQRETSIEAIRERVQKITDLVHQQYGHNH